jgi:hypothetical protein
MAFNYNKIGRIARNGDWSWFLRGEWMQGGEGMQIKQNREHRRAVGDRRRYLTVLH